MYYPLVKQDQFYDLAALCRDKGFERAVIESYMLNARIEDSALVLCNRLVLGDPKKQVCAAIEIGTGGCPVTLWAALIAEASETRDDILSFIGETQGTFSRPMAVGEFIARKKGRLS